MRLANLIFGTLRGIVGGAICIAALWVLLGVTELAPRLELPPIPWRLVVLGGAVIGGLVGLVRSRQKQIQEEQRAEGNRELAVKLNLQWEEPTHLFVWPSEFTSEICKGCIPRGRQRIYGPFDQLDCDVADVSFTEHYRDDGGSQTITHNQTVIMWRTAHDTFPPFTVFPRKRIADLLRAVFSRGVLLSFDAASVPGADSEIVRRFNETFVVRLVAGTGNTQTMSAARLSLLPHVMAKMLDVGKLHITASGNHIAMWRPDVILSPKQREDFLRQTALLVKTMLSAKENHSPCVVAEDQSHANSPSWDILPAFCALSGAIIGAMLGGVLLALTMVLKLDREFGAGIFKGFLSSHFVCVIGTAMALAGAGYLTGILIRRCYRPASR